MSQNSPNQKPPISTYYIRKYDDFIIPLMESFTWLSCLSAHAQGGGWRFEEQDKQAVSRTTKQKLNFLFLFFSFPFSIYKFLCTHSFSPHQLQKVYKTNSGKPGIRRRRRIGIRTRQRLILTRPLCWIKPFPPLPVPHRHMSQSGLSSHGANWIMGFYIKTAYLLLLPFPQRMSISHAVLDPYRVDLKSTELLGLCHMNHVFFIHPDYLKIENVFWLYYYFLILLNFFAYILTVWWWCWWVVRTGL